MSLTTLRFFALQAEHRGFKGDEVDAAWKALREHEAEATFLTLARRIPRVMMTQADRVARASRVDLAIAKKTTTLAAELRQEQQAVADLKAELTALKVQLNDERAGRAEVSATILLQERQIVDVRAEAAVAQTHATDVAAALREDLKSERELVVVMSARAEAAEVNASTQASTLHEQKGIIADLEGGLSQCERLVEAERARREEAVAADRKTAADIAIVVQDLKAERELVAKLSARVESAESNARVRASPIRGKDDAISGIRTELAKCELMVETERTEAAAALTAAEEHLEFRLQLLEGVINQAKATAKALELAEANVARLASVQESLQAELVVAKGERRRFFGMQIC